MPLDGRAAWPAMQQCPPLPTHPADSRSRRAHKRPPNDQRIGGAAWCRRTRAAGPTPLSPIARLSRPRPPALTLRLLCRRRRRCPAASCSLAAWGVSAAAAGGAGRPAARRRTARCLKFPRGSGRQRGRCRDTGRGRAEPASRIRPLLAGGRSSALPSRTRATVNN